jgi:hypothetical protein
MKENKDMMFKQVTCIEHLDDNEGTFSSMINSIKSGHAKDVIYEMLTWLESDFDPFSYDKILNMARDNNETIVYDDFNYLLTANENIIVLYQRIK